MTEPYWLNVNWMALAAMITAVGALSAPFFNGYLSSRSNRAAASATQTETAAARLERKERELFELTEKRAVEAERKVAECVEECEQCREASRGMEDWAHWYRHELVNLMRRFAALLEITEGAAEGKYAPERLLVMTTQTRAALPVAPPSVPLLHDAGRLKPPDQLRAP